MTTAALAALLPYEEALQTRGYETQRGAGTYGIVETVSTYNANGERMFTVSVGVDSGDIYAYVCTVHSPRGNIRGTVKSISDPTVEEALALFASFEGDGADD